jgi:uncharacterized protein DUF547
MRIGASFPRAIAAIVWSLVAACSTLPVSPSQVDADHADQAWARVLASYVDERGRVDFSGLGRHRAELDAYVAYVAATSPDDIADPKRRLAYLINAYNALSMYGVLDAGSPERLGWLGRLRFFWLERAVVGGKSISLYDLESRKIRPIGDERAHFALNCMSVSCPRLPRVPFEGVILDRQLDEATVGFFAEPRNVAVDAAQREIWLSEILSFYEDDFLRKAPSLRDYVGRWRDGELPPDYKIRFVPYDWTINRQPVTALDQIPLPSRSFPCGGRRGLREAAACLVFSAGSDYSARPCRAARRSHVAHRLCQRPLSRAQAGERAYRRSRLSIRRCRL